MEKSQLVIGDGQQGRRRGRSTFVRRRYSQRFVSDSAEENRRQNTIYVHTITV